MLISHLWERGYKLKREEKGQVLTELKNKFDRATAIILTDYRGLTVAEISELRRMLKAGNLEYKVVKNTLARIVSQNTSISAAKDSFKGPVGIAISYDDPVLVAKKVLEYSKKHDKLKVSSGIVEGKVCTVDDIKAIAELPPMKVLLSMFAGVLQAPLSKLAGALNATISSCAYAIESLRNKREA
ncbi:MAG: 50S ribosomal protein L10 [Nitrospira sp.]|nr:50S ribosomal protein L10 [Nitrospira sp.]